MNQKSRREYIASIKRFHRRKEDLSFAAGELWKKHPGKELELVLRMLYEYQQAGHEVLELFQSNLNERLIKIERWLERAPKPDPSLIKTGRRPKKKS